MADCKCCDSWEEVLEEKKADLAAAREEADQIADLHGLAIEKAQEWQGKCFKLEAKNERLRAALKAVEWVAHYDRAHRYCPWCNEWEPVHAPDCKRQEALK